MEFMGPPIDPLALRNFADEEAAIINLIRGTVDDEEFWAYLAVPPSKYEAFKEAEATGAYEVNDFGEILKWGKGFEPNAEDIQYMVDNYGIVPDLANQIEQAMEAMVDRGDAVKK